MTALRDRTRVLVAEDHPVNQRVATAMLENLGFPVDLVEDGIEAVKAAMTKPYRAIFMDCQLPLLDGYRATSEIRRMQKSHRGTPIIAVTGSGLSSVRQRCLAAGMDDYLTKPLSLNALAVVLARWAPFGSDELVVDVLESTPTAQIDLRNPSEPVASALEGPDPVASVLDSAVIARLERLAATVGDDLMGQLVVLFRADAASRVVDLREGLANDDSTAVGFAAHALSGASASLGAHHLARLCASLATHTGPDEPIDDELLLAAIEAELSLVRAALDAHISA